MLGPVLLNVCIGNLDKGIKATLPQVTDDTKLGRNVDLEDWKALQGILDRLDPRSDAN